MCTGTAFSNTAPSATNVSQTGIPVVFQPLTCTYNFSDPEGHIEGATLLNWVRMVDGVPIEIPGANGFSYQIAEGDIGHTLAFKVTPVDYYGLAGTPVISSTTATIIHLPYPQNFNAILELEHSRCSWQSSILDGRGFIGYRLYRDGLNIQTIPNPNTLSFTDTYVSNGTHEYYICALYSDPSNLSDPSPIVTVIVGVENDDLVAIPETGVKVSPNPFSQSAGFSITVKLSAEQMQIYN
jgi:hypothetical protein